MYVNQISVTFLLMEIDLTPHTPLPGTSHHPHINVLPLVLHNNEHIQRGERMYFYVCMCVPSLSGLHNVRVLATEPHTVLMYLYIYAIRLSSLAQAVTKLRKIDHYCLITVPAHT